ncbi:MULTISPECIES: 50S ribosomal protein L17 [Sporosarcina]|jgi:large subunit ribosomal protein L17|uniref:Large ribosomal subunit protein bL17 n=1 Tax=Sporosarcina psychrophila TaxID=1476 RepID=A0ABV2K8I6_SPOPS|nr:MULTISPECIES: 50S ribosomal protein L17 [Sporosarcina]AMQ04763.1 50S ribosomal protein L17 [Sporosarcina psychrophila]QNK88485.1 50S ribosomal protein L17 [Sporosarcina sp. resist]
MGYRKLGRTSSQRKAMLRDLATDLIVHERIQTTEARAKELRSVVEKMITLGKRGDLHARRQVAQFIRRELVTVADGEGNEKEIYAIQKLFDNVAPRYAERQGGYTRIMKMGPRRGDGAPVVVIELV